ncbi:GNAT family N-acetyltransferase [Kitasatospora sp. MAP5-34]|uniref:GNAT family N-acetyltransferase n=1 Tax=Kitasatospora sp. MAP5-34 TaxID=3035102 RepID=UPI0024765B23|nr:GNAT family N-acetyltransferase [Kitasatospora sp. MAP5-34]MDH6579091.1 GNAT superfamily N-acetyltransferase [Kitasatospora sp. MAP5-34]
MAWTLSTSLDEFHAAAGDFLAAHPAENTVLLTIVDRLGRVGPHAFGSGTPRFGWWQQAPEGLVEGAFLQTPPFGPALGRMSAVAAAHLASELLADGAPVTGVRGGKVPVEAFGWVWGNRSGTRPTVRANERMYRLGELAAPDPAPAGRARPVTEADRALMISWYDAFMADINVAVHTEHGSVVDQRTADGSLYLWEDGLWEDGLWEDGAGRPVSFAGVSPVIAGMSRIGPVYTPPELRGRGYASALVAAVSAHALAQGAREVLLYTDLANPTSNSIYQKLGYQPVQDCLTLDLTG